MQWTHDGALLSQLHGLKGLLLKFQNVDESTCRNLSRLSDLQDLSLYTSDRGCEIIASALSDLTMLQIGGPDLTDRGLESISRLSRTLQDLKIGDAPQLLGTGLSKLSSCSALTHLDLSFCGITDETMKHLSELPRLTNLTLDLEMLIGPGLGNLWKTPNLVSLRLDWHYDWHLSRSAFEYLPLMEHLGDRGQW